MGFRKRGSPYGIADDATDYAADDASFIAAVGSAELIKPQPRESDEPPPALECHNVSKWFGSILAVDDVSLSIEAGSVVAFIGRSGSGKSTLLRCFNGLELPTTGRVLIDGHPLDPADQFLFRQLRQRTGIVFQDFNLFPQYSIEANVVLAQRVVLRRSAPEAAVVASRVLDRVGMLGHRHKHPNQLSGGEQQRVAIARTLAMDPKILLLDEPTASVDPELTKGIMELIKEISDGDVTVVAVTHEVGFVRAAADVVFFFEDGALVEQGTVEQMLSYPKQESTQAFVADARLLG